MESSAWAHHSPSNLCQLRHVSFSIASALRPETLVAFDEELALKIAAAAAGEFIFSKALVANPSKHYPSSLLYWTWRGETAKQRNLSWTSAGRATLGNRRIE